MASAWTVSGQTETPLGNGSATIAVKPFFGKEPLRISSGHSDVRIATPR